MATQEATNSTHPQMIIEAVDGMKQKEGCNKLSIINYIESTHGDLPPGGTGLLTENLNELKDSGDLVFLRNNYMRPDLTSPLKQGRGRRPKPKDPAALEAQAQPESGSEVKRRSGRPKKDPNAPPAAKKVKVPTVAAPPSRTGRPR